MESGSKEEIRIERLLEHLNRVELRLYALQDELEEERRCHRKLEMEQQELRANALVSAKALADVRSSGFKTVHNLLLRWEAKIPGWMSILYVPAKKIRSVLSQSKAELQNEILICLESGYLKEGWYLLQNPGLVKEGVAPAEHWVASGWREGRDPGPDFQVLAYLEDHPDCKESGENPLLHFCRTGGVRLPSEQD